MQVTPADIADRFSILDLKMDRLPEEMREQVIEEHRAYQRAVFEENIPIEACCRLKEINGKIWDLEYDIRMGKLANPKTESEFAEIGRRALAIRDLNAQRIAEKNSITAFMGGHMEVKGLHASEALKV